MIPKSLSPDDPNKHIVHALVGLTPEYEHLYRHSPEFRLAVNSVVRTLPLIMVAAKEQAESALKHRQQLEASLRIGGS